MIIDEVKYLAHIGTPRHSGRYPWGSGDNPNQRHRDFLDTIEHLRGQGLSETQIYQGMNITSTEYRAKKSIAKNAERAALIAQIDHLKNDRGMSNVAIARQLGLKNESSVRSLLADGVKDRVDKLQATADMLRERVNQDKYIDIGGGVENNLHISKDKLGTAVAILKEEGYVVHNVQVPQAGTRNKTLVKVLAPEGTTYLDIKQNMDSIKQVFKHTDNGGQTWNGNLPPINVNPNRVAIRYKEDGGDEADGVIYVRPGKEDLSLGGAQYAQVRVAVGGSHYLKGMAVYKDDLPDGVDLMFNTNKSNTGNKLDAMKKQAKDPNDPDSVDETNPFGAIVRQIGHTDPATGRVTKVTSAMNIVNEEGKWDQWSKNLSTQMLSKQSPSLAKTQLDKTYTQKKKDLDEIMALTNPAVRDKLLRTYADEADSAAVHLKAAAMPGQRTQVILPVKSLKPTEIYAPNFDDNTRVALVRYPHGGKFEIPELVVNNKNREATKLLGRAADAVGINHEVAKRLSGADFDGDTVLVIPNNKGLVKSEPALKDLEGFDPQARYPKYEGMKVMSEVAKGREMGDVSNLITDMTIRGANNHELARAVKHSMVVIDAAKHELNYKQSAIDNNIRGLKIKYQGKDGQPGKANSGAATLISLATSPKNVDERKRTYKIDPATGKKVWTETGNTYTDKTGKVVKVQSRTTKLADTDDAHTLSSGTRIESIYADHSNRLKALGDLARKEAANTKTIPWDETAKKVYASEVDRLNSKLNIALMNRPIERQAQIIANAHVKAIKDSHPEYDEDDMKKVRSMALVDARARVGAKKTPINIEPTEWQAIQAGAISNHKLKQILDNTDIEIIKSLATPKARPKMDAGNKARAQSLLASGKTQAEVAQILGVSLTTLKEGVK